VIALPILCLFGIFSTPLYPATVVSEPKAAASPAQVTAKSAESIRILTWNLLEPRWWERLAGALGLDAIALARARRENEAIQGLQADVIALQEVSASFLQVRGTGPEGQDPYQATLTQAGVATGGLLLLSRFPILDYRYRKLASPTGRYALFATLAVKGQVLTVAVAHLESPPEARRARERQLAEIDGRLDSRHRSVWLGDFNLGDQDPEQGLALLSWWIDGGVRQQPPNQVTYDLETNPLARENAFPGEASRRLDRILLSADLTPLDAGLVGQAAGGEPPPSDHYGVWVDVRLTGATPPRPVEPGT